MEHHNHETFEITHEGNPFNELFDALEYDQVELDKQIQQTNKRIDTVINALLTLELNSAAKFALLELSAK